MMRRYLPSGLRKRSQTRYSGTSWLPGHDDLRPRQAVEEGARLLELRAARALRQVARDDDEVGLDRRRPRASSGSISAGSTRPKCRSERWTRVRMAQSSGRGVGRGGRDHDAGSPGGCGSAAAASSRVTSPSVATRRRRCRLSTTIVGGERSRRSRAPGEAGRRARAARAAAGAAGRAAARRRG